MPKPPLLARILAVTYVCSYPLQIACFLGALLGAFVWARNGFTGWGLWCWVAGMAGLLACVGVRPLIIWVGRRYYPAEERQE